MTVPVAILGGTGLVGQRLIARLESHPWFDPVVVAASDPRLGERYGDTITWRIDEPMPASIADIRVDRADPDDLSTDVDLVLSALPGEVATEIETRFAEDGALVCSNASPGRMDPDVPLLIPEVNYDHLALIDQQRDARGWEGAIVKNANCMTTTVTLPFAGIDRFGLTTATVVSMQAISGAGTSGVHGIDIVDNVLPDIAGEADKLASEPQKLLGSLTADGIVHHTIEVDAACHRVPVTDGHLATCFVDVETAPTRESVIDALSSVPTVDLPSAPTDPITVIDEPRRPQPRYDRHVSDGMGVAVGPVAVAENRISFSCLAHNTVRGAAGACLLAAEAAVDAGYLS